MKNNSLSQRYFLIIAIFIIWIGFATRLHHLGNDSLWMDEITTANVVRDNHILSVRDHPPLLYILVSSTTRLFKENEFFLRLPSALAAILTLPMLMRFGYLLRYPAAGLWAAFLLNLLPFHLRYAQEARHYSLLLLFSLATYVLLWLALKKTKIRYFIGYGLFTVLNMYTHYGALVVLASQSILIAGWLILQIVEKKYKNILNILLSASIVLLLYMAWIPRLQVALMSNLGDDAVASTGFVSFTDWLQEILFAFSFNSNELSYLTGILGLVGLIIITIRKQWMTLAFMITGLIFPLLLIQLLHVSRWAFPKYVIYMLPFYILSVSITIDYGVTWLQQKVLKENNKGYAYVALPVVFALILISFPLLEGEYKHVERDWRSIADTLGQKADEGDIILAVTMDMDDFNQVKISLPYYLEQELSNFTLLSATSLDFDKLQEIVHSDTKIWAVLFNRVIPIILREQSNLQVESFQGSLYLLENPDQTDKTFLEIINIYEQIIPLTRTPMPQCLLKRDLALLYVIEQDFLLAKQWFEDAQMQCPGQISSRYAEQDLVLSIYLGLIEQFESQGQTDKAVLAATQLFHIDSKNESALNTLAIFDVIEAFESDNLSLLNEQATNPVQIQRFSMPYDGDWGEVLLIHPPSSVSFAVQIPEKPTLFYSRVAMYPDSWYWGGDGSEFVVQIQTEDMPPTDIYRQYVSNNQSDQKWHEVTIPLQQYAGQVVTFTLMSEPGPNGDFSGDWAGWESPLIMWDVP